MIKEEVALKKITKLLESREINKDYALKIIDTLKTAIPRKMSKLFRDYKNLRKTDKRFVKFKKDLVYARILCLAKESKI